MANKKVKDFERQFIYNRKNLNLIISECKYFLSSGSYKNYLLNKIAKKSLPGYSYIFSGTKVDSIDKIHLTKFIPYHDASPIIKDIEWQQLVLSFYKEEIKEFLKLKEQYTYHLLVADYAKAAEVINSINSITYSFWSIEQELLCSELHGGLEGNRTTLSEIGKKTNKFLVALISEFYSSKVGLMSSHTSFIHKLNNFITQLSEDFGDQILTDYLRFLYTDELDILKEKNLKKILSFSSTLPIIDMYENLIKVITIIFSSNQFTVDLKHEIKEILLQLDIADQRVINLIASIDGVSNDANLFKEKNSAVKDIIELYTIGNYGDAIKLVETYDKEYGLNFTLIDLLSKMCIYLNTPPEQINVTSNLIKKNILEPIFHIYSCNEKEKNLNILLNTLKIFGDLNVRYEIETFYLNHRYSNQQEKLNFKENFASIYSEIISPKHLLLDQLEQTREVSKTQFKLMGYTQTIDVFEKVIKPSQSKQSDSDIPIFRENFYYAKGVSKRSLDLGIEKFKELLSSIDEKNDHIFKYKYEKVAVELFNLYLKKNELIEAVKLLVDSYFIDPSIILRMDSSELLRSLQEQDIKTDSLKLVILVYLVDPKNHIQNYMDLVTYIESINLTLPSELMSLEETTSKERYLIYFILEHIYTKEVMKYFVFLDPKLRNIERIKVLKFLIEQKYGNLKLKESEIDEINKFESIQKRIKAVDEKKIFVDTAAIIRENDQIYREKFKQYLLMDSLDTNLTFYDIQDFNSTLTKFNDDVKEEFKTNPEKKYRYLLFKEMLIDFINELTTNRKYGLEKFLSSRIRHGVLENTLTKTLKYHNLLSLKQDKSGSHLILNKYREQELESIVSEKNSQNIELIKGYLNEFSNTIVNQFEEIKNWIRLQDKKYPNGMFNYSQFEFDANVLMLYSDFNEITNYNVFYSALTDYFWVQTEYHLNKIRERFLEEVNSFIINNLNTLESKLLHLKDKDSSLENLIGLISRDINVAKATIKHDLFEISNWFIVRRSNEFHDFSFSDLIETGLEIVKKSNKANVVFNTIAEIQEDTLVKGEHFNYLIDIFTMLYSNAIKHSGFENLGDLNIYTNIKRIAFSEVEKALNDQTIEGNWANDGSFSDLFNTEGNYNIKITVSNTLDAKKDPKEIAKIIKKKFDVILDKEQSEEMILGEGGTGISKVYYILEHNLKVPFIQRYYVNEHKMFAEFILNIEELKAKELAVHEVASN
ncbi:hypothetical protein QUF88_04895 [Bacillus sp. DX1.1]|uniref:hypothetical protein n=1 Tax=Bacillus sp. DX1.1 TaxID=3055866 RepID=UPI0025A2B224|nr:hypothetical protein [Bacillus sp. DX1.1]MDM5153225.1 hypothetical protein [Bacillus sp. DX1.1]